MRFTTSAAFAAVAACLLASQADAAVTFYTGDAGRTAFAGAAGTLASEDFEGLTTRTSGGIGYLSYATFSRNGVSITGTGGNGTLSVLDSTYLNGGNQVRNRFGADAGAVLDGNYDDLNFTFDTAVNAFAVDLATYARGLVGTSSGTFTVAVAGASGSYSYSGSSGLGFLGLTSDTGFTALKITTPKSYSSAFNNVRFGPLAAAAPVTGAVPEPATWGLMLAGFGLVGAGLRGRRRSTAVSFG